MMTGPGDPRSRATALHYVRTTTVALCWLIFAGLILLELLRLTGLDAHAAPLIALSTAWPLVTLSGVLVMLGAACIRRPLLGGAAVVMLALLIVAWWPAWVGEVGAGPKGSPQFRLLALNVEYSADTGAAASRQIRSQNPDVVVLSELSPLTLRHLDLRQYRYSWQRPQSKAFGQGVWSRWPLVDVSTCRAFPPLLPLDHVLVSRGIGVRHYGVLGAIGSDHRAVVADLTINP
jgi:endonuclease/exonuclease/phosphatase (EEP) superfamily protein YafD